MSLFEFMKELFDQQRSARNIEITVTPQKNKEAKYVLVFTKLIRGDNEIHFTRTNSRGQRDIMRYYWDRSERGDFMKRVEITHLSVRRSVLKQVLVVNAIDGQR